MTTTGQDPQATLTSTPDGRVTIPAQIRRAASIEPGQTIVVYVEDGRIVMEERKHMIKRLQRETMEALRVSGFGVNAADALTMHRRSEASREEQP